MRVLVVGGGITGLAAAWEASARGAEVVVCEADDVWGGKVRTEMIEGCRMELGPDSVVAYRPAALTLARELGIADEIIAPRPGRRVCLHARGGMRPMPDGMGMVLPTKIWPFVTTGILSWPDKLRAACDLLIPRQLRDGQDIAIGALLRRRLGRGIVERFADPMVGGIYGATVDELSLDAVLPSLREQEQRYRSLMLASIASGRTARQRKGATAGPASPFRAPRDGMGRLTDVLVEQLREREVDLRLSTRVTTLQREGAVTVAFMSTTSSGGESALGQPAEASERFDAVVLAGGVTSSEALLRPHIPAAADALAAIPLASTTVLTLAFDATAFEPVITTQGWLEAQEAPISGVTVSSMKYEGRAPEDTVLVRAFVPERLGPLCHAPEDELCTTVEPWVIKHLGAQAAPRWRHIQRWPHVMPKYVVGHLDRVAAVERELRAVPSWRVAGSALHGVGVPDCIADGRAQVTALLEPDPS